MGTLVQPSALPKRHRFSADDYQRLGETGVLSHDLRVELIDGQIIEMAAEGTAHWAMVARLGRLLRETSSGEAIVSTRMPFRLDDYSEPQRDIALFEPREDFYVGALPTPAETWLVVEVADTSARYDREVKLPLYARRGVPELWIVDLEAKLLRMYRDPAGDDYLTATATRAPGVVGIAALPEVPIDLSGLLD